MAASGGAVLGGEASAPCTGFGGSWTGCSTGTAGFSWAAVAEDMYSFSCRVPGCKGSPSLIECLTSSAGELLSRLAEQMSVRTAAAAARGTASDIFAMAYE